MTVSMNSAPLTRPQSGAQAPQQIAFHPAITQPAGAAKQPAVQFGANNDGPDIWGFFQKALDQAKAVGTEILQDPKKALQEYGENRMVYQPTLNGLIPQRVSLDSIQDTDLRAKIEEVNFTTADGVKLHGWYIPPKNGDLTIVYSHGNGGNIGIRGPVLKFFTDAGYGMLAYDYRGYGNSEGSPNEAGLYQDVEAASNFLRDQKATPYNEQIMLGESIGGAMAIDAASKNNYRMLVTLCTFTSLPEVAGSLFKNVPGVSAITKSVLPQIIQQQYPSYSKLSSVVSPTLIVHGTNDELVPYEMSNRLYEKLEQRPNGADITDHLEATGADHNNVLGAVQGDIINVMRALEARTMLMYPRTPQI